MGTNYYVRTNCCKECGRSDEEIHIGKSSFGWRFSLQVNYETKDYWQDYKTFVEFIKKPEIRIFNEYHEEKTIDWLIDLIESKKEGISHKQYAKEHPNEYNMLFVDHKNKEDGPVDLCYYEFS